MNKQDELESAIAEYKAVCIMPESEACRLYNVDGRQEIEAILLEEINILQKEVDKEKEASYDHLRDCQGNYTGADCTGWISQIMSHFYL